MDLNWKIEEKSTSLIWEERKLHLEAPGSGFPKRATQMCGSCAEVPPPLEAVEHSTMFLLVAIWMYSLSPDRSMGSVCVDTTLQGITVRNVHHYTMISLGSQEMEKQEHPMNAKVSGREFTDLSGFQDEHSWGQPAKFPNKDFCQFTLMVLLQKLGLSCWSLMEDFSMHVVLLQQAHLGYWEVEFTTQKSVLHAAMSPHEF